MMSTFRNTNDLYENLIFGNGEISIFNTNEILIPTNTFVVFMEAFRNTKVNVENLLYAIGKQEGKYLCNTFKRRNLKTRQEELKLLLNFIEYAGLGHFYAVRASQPNFLFKSESPTLAKQHIKLNIRKNNTETYVVGIIAGFLEKLYEKPLRGQESQCIVKGYSQCVIEIKEGSSIPEEEKIEGMVTSKDFFYNTQIKPDHNSIIEKALVNRHLVLENGEVKLWNFSTTFIPIASLLLYEKYIQAELGKDSASFFYFIGKKQAHAASWIQIKQYGRKNDLKLYLSMFQHHELIGCGKGKVLEFDEKSRKVKLESSNNTYLRYHDLLFKTIVPANNYLAGLTSGITAAYFNKEIQSKETEPKAGYCSFVLYEKETSYPDIIEEITKNSLTVRGYLK